MHDLSLLVFNHGFEIQNSVCNGCHDLTILYFNISDVAIVTVKDFNYFSFIYDISKYETVC